MHVINTFGLDRTTFYPKEEREKAVESWDEMRIG